MRIGDTGITRDGLWEKKTSQPSMSGRSVKAGTLFVFLQHVLGTQHSTRHGVVAQERCAQAALGRLEFSPGSVCYLGFLCLTRFPWLLPLQSKDCTTLEPHMQFWPTCPVSRFLPQCFQEYGRKLSSFLLIEYNGDWFSLS